MRQTTAKGGHACEAFGNDLLLGIDVLRLQAIRPVGPDAQRLPEGQGSEPEVGFAVARVAKIIGHAEV